METSEVRTQPQMQVIAPAVDPIIEYQAALYFLEGQYLFRSRERAGWSSKFVTSADVAAAFTGREEDTGWIPAGVVRAGRNQKGEWFVYSAPEQRVQINLEGELLEIPIPRTVLVGVGRSYSIFALKSGHFDPSEPAWQVPFPNVETSEGLICWGGNTPDLASPQRARKVWELFFGTPFNDHHDDGKSQSSPKDIKTVLRQLAQDKAKKYPLKDLVEARQSIGQIVNGLLR
jgi:hypothetical protein